MADIPGLIEGAAEGAGLGLRFLKHLQRTRLLLHLVDIAPLDPEADPVRDARAIVGELKKFSKELAAKPRSLILNKHNTHTKNQNTTPTTPSQKKQRTNPICAAHRQCSPTNQHHPPRPAKTHTNHLSRPPTRPPPSHAPPPHPTPPPHPHPPSAPPRQHLHPSVLASLTSQPHL